MLAVANGHELLAAVTGTGCMSSAMTGCFLAAKPTTPLEAAAEALAAFGVAGEDAAARREGPGLVPRQRSTTRSPALDPATLDRTGDGSVVRLHALVDDLEHGARLAVEGGATVIQWRLKDAPDARGRRARAATRSLCARHGVPFVVNDDVEAALMLGADGVHLGRADEGAERARRQGLMLGLSAARLDEARAAAALARLHRRRARCGRRRRSRTRTRRSGSTGSREICAAVDPVVAIGGIDASTRPTASRAGAAGVAVIRAARDAAACGRRSMRLSDVGELGLLAELERRGLARAIEHDAAQVGGLVVTQDALVEGVHFRLDWISWRDLGWRAAAVNLSDLAASGRRAGGAGRHARAPGRDARRGRGRAVRGHRRDRRPGRRRRHDRARRSSSLSVTALGRSERVPGRGGARPATCSSSPARSARRARPSALGATSGRRSGSTRGGGSAATPTRCSTSRTGSPRRRALARAPAAACVVELERVPLAEGASWTTSASARTTSCSRRSPTRPASP